MTSGRSQALQRLAAHLHPSVGDGFVEGPVLPHDLVHFRLRGGLAGLFAGDQQQVLQGVPPGVRWWRR
jgi:hypothetical protein